MHIMGSGIRVGCEKGWLGSSKVTELILRAASATAVEISVIGSLNMQDESADEERSVTLGMSATGELLVVVWTWRDAVVRVISARCGPYGFCNREEDGSMQAVTDMKAEYDFSRAKRGSVLPAAAGKDRIIVSIWRSDNAVLDWFRKRAHEAGGASYHVVPDADQHGFRRPAFLNHQRTAFVATTLEKLWPNISRARRAEITAGFISASCGSLRELSPSIIGKVQLRRVIRDQQQAESGVAG